MLVEVALSIETLLYGSRAEAILDQVLKEIGFCSFGKAVFG